MTIRGTPSGPVRPFVGCLEFRSAQLTSGTTEDVVQPMWSGGGVSNCDGFKSEGSEVSGFWAQFAGNLGNDPIPGSVTIALLIGGQQVGEAVITGNPGTRDTLFVPIAPRLLTAGEEVRLVATISGGALVESGYACGGVFVQ